jgi:8-oxo-dGTP pyrophosphatase MutT (NUDIX family)
VTVQSSTLYQIEARLRSALAAPLPGGAAHVLLAPRPRLNWTPDLIPDDAHPAAVLILLYPIYDTPHILLTVRDRELQKHAGQVSLPGGRLEPDETMVEAALREASEEVGLDPGPVSVIGELSTLYVPVSGFAIHPVIGVSTTRQDLVAADGEVGRILEVPIAALVDRDRLRPGARWHRGRFHDVPYFELCEERVWGATAMVLAELLAVLGAPPRDVWDTTGC